MNKNIRIAKLRELAGSLRDAAFAGHLEEVQRLLQEGASAKVLDEHGNTPLYWAVCAGHLEVVRCLHEAGAAIESKNATGETPLIRAASACYNPNSLAIARFLLDSGADVNAADQHGVTPLMRAAQGGHLEIARELLRHGADIAVRASFQENALTLTCRARGDFAEMVQLLIEHGADTASRDQNRYDLVTAAAQTGNVRVLRVLLDAGLSPEGDPQRDAFPLFEAIKEGHDAAALYLIDAGANVHRTCRHGQTALMEAAAMGKLQLVEALLAAGADVNARTDTDAWGSQGTTVLMHALGVDHAIRYDHTARPKIDPRLVQVLLEHGADVNATTTTGLSVQSLAEKVKGARLGNLIKKHLKTHVV